MKLVHSDFDKITGKTSVTVADRYGKYTGIAKLHPEDKNNYIVGGTIAETRAMIKACKSRLSREKIRLQTLISFKNEFSLSPEDIILLNKKIKLYQKNIEGFKVSIEYRETFLKHYLKERTEISETIKKMMDKKE